MMNNSWKPSDKNRKILEKKDKQIDRILKQLLKEVPIEEIRWFYDDLKVVDWIEVILRDFLHTALKKLDITKIEIESFM